MDDLPICDSWIISGNRPVSATRYDDGFLDADVGICNRDHGRTPSRKLGHL